VIIEPAPQNSGTVGVNVGVTTDQPITTAPPDEFSLVVGGPVYQFLLRARLIRPPLGHAGARMAVIALLAWLPLLVLTVTEGRFASGVKIPFLYDVEVHSRLLCALPLLIVAEVLVYRRMHAIVSQFIARQIITAKVRLSFDAAVASATRWRNSVPAECFLFLVVFLAGPHIWRGAVAMRSDTWYATVSGSASSYTPAGYWYAFVSVPIFQFILLRWYYRIFIWSRFLFQVARLDLNMVALHPDRCCGLGFLGNVAAGFGPLLMAHSCVVSGYIANRILHEGATLPGYRFELLGLTAMLLIIVLGPLCVFLPRLNAARLAGLQTYGPLASEYVVAFAEKWAGGAKAQSEPLLGSSDIQSLADLANSYAVVNEVRLVPFGKQAVLRFLIFIAIPLLPLLFTMFSADELLKRVLTTLF
jgi:hypothetical protein